MKVSKVGQIRLSNATVTDPAGKQKKSQSDGLGRVVTAYEPDVANGNQLTQQTTYTYNVFDGLTQVTQGSQTRTLAYDALGRLTDSTTPEAGHFQYQYNSFNLMTQRTDARGVITTYGYDTLNRLASVSYNVGSIGVPATSTVSYTYGTSAANNNNGRLLTLTDGPGTETYSYDNLGRTTQVQKVISGTTYTSIYTYNLASELTSITYPSGRIVQQSYDAIGRLCAIGNFGSTCSTGTMFASGLAYNKAGQVTAMNYGNGVSTTLGYTPERLLLQTLSYAKGATTLLNLSYGYTQNGGNNGQITSIADNTGTQEAGRSVTYTYDALYRLSTAVTTGTTNYPQWGLSWSYDRYGNRTAQTVTAGSGVPSNSVTVSASTNRISGSPYAYDANGNMANDGANTLTYDAENHAVTAAGATYSYDGNGLRVKKVSGGTTTVYLFSGSKVLAEYVNGAAVGSPTREYVYSGGTLLAKIEAGVTNYYHSDHLSARVITDSTGTVVGQRAHYPYGETWYETGTTTKIKFTSYERDSESGNDFAMARYHINRLGRFNAADPISGSAANPQSWNRYAYTASNPTNLVDPAGMTPSLEQVTPDGIVFGAGGSSWGRCAVDFMITDCGFASTLLTSGAALQCPNNMCDGTNNRSQAIEFHAFAGGGGGYYSFSGPGALYYSLQQAAIAFANFYEPRSTVQKAEYLVTFYEDAQDGVFSYAITSVAPCQPLVGPFFACTGNADPTAVPPGMLAVATGHTHPLQDELNNSDVFSLDDMYQAYRIFLASDGAVGTLFVGTTSGRVLAYDPSFYVPGPGPGPACQRAGASVIQGSRTPSPLVPCH